MPLVCRHMGLLSGVPLPGGVEEEGVQADQGDAGEGVSGVCAQMPGLVDQQKRMCSQWPETVE